MSADKFSLPTEINMNERIYKFNYPSSVPIFDYFGLNTRTFIGVATLVNLSDSAAVYESSIPIIEGQGISGGWRWTDADQKLTLVEVCYYNSPGFPITNPNKGKSQ